MNSVCMVCVQVNCPIYIVHVMSKSAAKAVMRGKEKGIYNTLSINKMCVCVCVCVCRSCSVWRAYSC